MWWLFNFIFNARGWRWTTFQLAVTIHDFKLISLIKIIAGDSVKQIWSYRTTTLSQRDFTISSAEFHFIGEKGLNKWNQGILQNVKIVVLGAFSYNT